MSKPPTSIPWHEQHDGNIPLSGSLFLVVIALFVIAWGVHYFLLYKERR